MTIREIWDTEELQVAVEKVKMCSTVQVGFINNKGMEDETELDVHENILTFAGRDELSDLFASLVVELCTTEDKVEYCRVVKSVDTLEELEKLDVS